LVLKDVTDILVGCHVYSETFYVCTVLDRKCGCHHDKVCNSVLFGTDTWSHICFLELKESNVRLKLTVVDTVAFGDQIDKSDR